MDAGERNELKYNVDLNIYIKIIVFKVKKLGEKSESKPIEVAPLPPMPTIDSNYSGNSYLQHQNSPVNRTHR